MKSIIRKVGYDYGIEIVALEIPEDHIHMVVRSEPKQSPSKIIQVIKSISAQEFFRMFPSIKKKLFWGVSCGLNAFSLSRSETPTRIQSGSMFKIS